MDDAVTICCPYCFQTTEVYLEPETQGQMVQDCEVCCRPWELHVERDADGAAHVTVLRAQ